MEEGGIVLRDERKISISRVPKRTKEIFTNLAEEQFCDDYGLCFKYLLEQALEYQKVKEILFKLIEKKYPEGLEELKGGNEKNE